MGAHFDRSTPAGGRIAMAAMLIAVALFLFVDPTGLPIVLWDESRNVVSALEMRTGWSLVTTYGGAPDLWNTKPPLLIWAMRASVGVFGASEWALRLPSTLAALATFGMVLAHVRRSTGSLVAALLAAALLALSPAMFGEHSVRTADYDALLIAFTTIYCCLAFDALIQERARLTTLIAAGGAVAGAVLTKSVAGLIPGLGLAVFAVASGRWRAVVRDPRYAIAALTAIVPVAAFLIAREAAGPGYLAAAWHNDVADRFRSSVVGMERPWSFYLSDLAAGYFSAPLLLLAAPVAWRLMSLSERRVVGHAGAIILAELIVASIAATKLHHYILPALPFMAVAAAVAAWALARWAWAARHRAGTARVFVVAVALILLLTALGALGGAISRRYLAPQISEGARAGGYGALFRTLGRGTVIVVDHGFINDGRPGYAPVLRAYQLIAQDQGRTVRRAATIAGDGTVASCEARVVAALERAGRAVARAPGCVAVRLPPSGR